MEKFKDIFLFAPKSKIKAGEGLDKGRFPFYTSSAIQNKWIDTEQHFDEALIFGTGGSASIHYESQPFSTSTDCFVTITTRRDVNTKYVFYFLSSNIHILERGFKGAGLKHLSKKFLEEIEIPLPDLETQNKIVAILDKANGILDKREETIKKYDELLRATFLDMFGDPGKMKLESKLGEVIEELSDYHANGSYESLREIVELKSEPDYALMVRTTDLEKNNFTDNVNYISKEAYESLNKSKLFGGEIIMNKIGSAGKIYLMPNLNRPVSLGMNAFLLRFEKNTSNVYVFSYLSTAYAQKEINSRVKGAVTKTITKDSVREIPFLKPDYSQQILFENIYFKINRIIASLNLSKANIETLINSLSQLAFKGELNFNTAVDLEVLLENDYQFFKENSNSGSIKLLIERLNTDELNENRFYEQQTYDKAKSFVFELIKEGKVKQIFDEKTKKVKLTV